MHMAIRSILNVNCGFGVSKIDKGNQFFQVEQKLAGMDTQVGDKQKQGDTAKDKDSMRASILDEAVIVCWSSPFIVMFNICLIGK